MLKKHQLLKVPFFLLIFLFLAASCSPDTEKALAEALLTVEAQQTQTADAQAASASVDEAVALTVAAQNATPTLSVDEIVALTVAAQNVPPTLSVDEIVALTVAANEASSNSGDSDNGANTGGDASASEPTLESVKIEVDPNTASGTPQLKVNTSSINVRRGPGTNYRPISSLLKDSVVEVIAKNQNDSWYLIKLPNGEKGWVANSVTDPVNDADMAKVSVAATIPAPPTNTPTATATTAATATPTQAATATAAATTNGTATPTKAATHTPTPSPTATSPSTQTSILVRNLTPLDYCSLFIQPSGDSDLGPERLNGDVLNARGSSTTVFLPEGEYDIQVVDCSGNVTKTKSNVLVITPFEWNIPEHMIELTINNDTSATDICWLFVDLSDDPWGDNILQPNERLQPGGGLFIQMPAGEYDAMAENCDGSGVVSEWSNNLITSNQTWSITD